MALEGLNLYGEILSYIVTILSVFSIVGAFLTILTFTLFRSLRTYPIKLIIYLCYSILLAQLFFLLSFVIYDTFMCIPSAILIHYFFLADFCWSFCVAFNFYQMIVSRNREAETYELYYHIACWGIPSLAVIGVGGADEYDNLGAVCYIVSPIAKFVGFFLVGLVTISANTVIFFFISREIHETIGAAPGADKREKSKEYRVYLSIFISIGLNWIFGFIMTLFPLNSVPYLLFLTLFSLTAPLQGFLIFASYCWNVKVMSHWAGLLGRCFPYFKRLEGGLGSTRTTNNTGSRV